MSTNKKECNELYKEIPTNKIFKPISMKPIINSFRNEFFFLSNFYPCKIIDPLNNIWPSAEHFYQAMKTNNKSIQNEIKNHPIKGLKNKAKSIPLRKNWNSIKYEIMLRIVHLKFKQNKKLTNLLIKTNNAILIEENYWHDNYWGNCTCNKCNKIKGKNNLGKILMIIRKELKNN